jgi:palmitoyltransferase
VYFELWGLAISEDIRIGTVFLLALLSAPLSLTLLLYHLYLIWAGMTTNESAKWTDWREDIADGFAFKAKRSLIYGTRAEGNSPAEPNIAWPVDCDQTLIFTNGDPPKIGYQLTRESKSIIQPDDPNATVDPRWTRVRNLNEVVNVYDLGFWRNLRDGLRIP